MYLRKYLFRFSVKKWTQELTDKLTTVGGYNPAMIEALKIGENGRVEITLKLDQNYRKIRALIAESLQELNWIKDLDIKMAAKKTEIRSGERRANLVNVKKLIAVSSCKGGVGKSTIALNLTFALSKLNLKVGIFDADIYGPSLPTLIGKEKQSLEAPADRPKEVIPIEFEGVKTMSYGFVNSKAVMRGPMISSIVTQLIHSTIWGDLDYLVVDLPPGTGDVQITLCQELSFDGAVIVTTPQRLSFIDVVKGIEMFDVLKVPTLSVVENMAEYECPDCHSVHRPFGPGYMNMLQKQFGIKSAVSIPLIADISKYSDLGSPVVLTLPAEHTISKLYDQLAQNVIEQLKVVQVPPPHVRYETGSKLVIVRQEDGTEKKIKAVDLRRQCSCALCVDEFTGKRIAKDVDDEVFPNTITPKGNYAVAITWSDGHRSSIYPYATLMSLK